MTLFHMENGFLGRTCVSLPVALVLKDGKYETDLDDYVFFHSSFVPETLQIIVELVVYEIMGAGEALKTTMFSAGWAILELNMDGKKKSAPILTGTPRFLLEDAFKSIFLL